MSANVDPWPKHWQAHALSTGDGLLIKVDKALVHLKGYKLVAGHIVPLDGTESRLASLEAAMVERDAELRSEIADLRREIAQWRDLTGAWEQRAKEAERKLKEQSRHGLSLAGPEGGELSIARGGELSVRHANLEMAAYAEATDRTLSKRGLAFWAFVLAVWPILFVLFCS